MHCHFILLMHTAAVHRLEMKILIVEDDRSNCVTLQAMVNKIGHQAVIAKNGVEGVELFNLEQPDLVLMDVLMPLMDGYECAKNIKAACGGSFVPIIFLTALNDDDELAQCVASGGDDFLSKPYNYMLIKAKIDAMQRIHDLYKTLALHKAELEHNQAIVERELELAHHVFQAVTTEQAGSINPINQWSRAVGRFSGDLVIYERSPTGQLHVMLGDFTGHGLSAAIGVIPVSDIFFSMTRKGFSIVDVATEINKKLNRVLPTGHFCAACLISIDRGRERIEIWNGGLPPALIIDHQGRIIRRIISSKLPLGIIGADEFDIQTEVFFTPDAHSILVYSDGLVEAANSDGVMFGEAGLEQAVLRAGSVARIFESVKAHVAPFIKDSGVDDDISLLQVHCGPLFDERRGEAVHSPADTLAGHWSMEVVLGYDTLKKIDPLPLFMNWLMQTHLPDSQRTQVYTILAELINNSIDHGLLELDSAMKSNPDGFENYYARRRELMDKLSSGSITVGLSQQPVPGGRSIKVSVQDTGSGFDISKVYSELRHNDKLFGRGIILVRSLCAKLDYQGCGNSVEAQYYG